VSKHVSERVVFLVEPKCGCVGDLGVFDDLDSLLVGTEDEEVESIRCVGHVCLTSSEADEIKKQVGEEQTWSGQAFFNDVAMIAPNRAERRDEPDLCVVGSSTVVV